MCTECDHPFSSVSVDNSLMSNNVIICILSTLLPICLSKCTFPCMVSIVFWRLNSLGDPNKTVGCTDKLKVNDGQWLSSPEAGSGFGTVACWTLKTHFDRSISSLAVDVLWGADDTFSLMWLRAAFIGITLRKTAIYTSAPGIRLNNDMQEWSTISPCSQPNS